MINWLKRRKRDFKFDVSISLALHVVVWTLILATLVPQFVHLAVKHLTDKKQQASQKDKSDGSSNEGATESMPPPSQQTAAVALVEAQMKQAVDGELTKEDQKKLMESMHEDLLKDADKMKESNPNEQDIGKLSSELQKQALEDMAAKLKDMAAESLKDEVDTQLDGGIYDQIKNKIENGANTQMNQEMADKIRERLKQERDERIAKNIDKLEQVKKQFTDAKNIETQAAANVRDNQLAPAADATKKSAAAANDADKAAHDALTDVVKNFPQTAGQADQTAKVLAGDTQQALTDAGTAIAAQNKDSAMQQLAKADDSLNQRVNAINQLEDQVRQTANTPDADPVSQNIMAQATADLQKTAGEELQKQSLDAMSGKVDDRLNQALAAQAAKMNVSPDQLKSIVDAEVKSRLPANFKEHPPQIDGMLTSARNEDHLLTADEVEKARQTADDALKALQDARQAEASVATNDNSKKAEDVVEQQEKATDQYHKAHDAMEKARDAAREVSVADQGKIFNMGDSDRRAEAEAKLNVIPELVSVDQRAPADNMKNQVVQSLDERIAQMKDLEDGLSHEKDTLNAQPKASTAQVKVDPAVLAAVTKDLKGTVVKVTAEQLPGMLAAAGDAEASDAQATDMRMSGIQSLLGKVGQLQSNMAEGRPGVGLENGGLGFGAGMGAGSGGGVGPGAGGPPVGNLYGSRFAAINADAIEKYGKDLRDRTDPDKFYEDPKATEEISTVAHAVDPGDLPALVYLGPNSAAAPSDPTTPAAAPAPGAPAVPERTVPEPKFKTVAFGSAAMMDQPITVDGDLSDWGELRHPMPTRFRSDGVPVTDPTQVYVRWSPDGLYIGYTTKKAGPIVPDAHQGDCMELWIDGQNVRRKQMSESPTSQQIFIAPFGYQGNPAPAIIEVGRGMRGLKMFTRYVDTSGAVGKVAAKMVPGGYSVEAFISRKAIAYPNLVPGAYLAFNFSVNRGPNETDMEQWSAPKSMVTWDKPDTWGDLLLLGSDAKARFISYDDPNKPVQPLIPGQPLAFEVQDKDMDLNPNKKDRIPAVLKIKGEDDGLFVILEETTPNSGIFRASVNTQPYGAPPQKNTLNIRGGESVELIYNDLRAEYGEANRVVTVDLPVGSAVLSFAGHP